MIRQHRAYELDDDPTRLDFDRIHSWLASAYWSPGIERKRVERAARHSALVVGAYRDGVQAGYLRIVSDRTSFAWICDVFVEETHRRQGLAKAMVRFALEHPDFQGLRRWLLATRDAHGVYAECGFAPLTNPERWMAHIPSPSP